MLSLIKENDDNNKRIISSLVEEHFFLEDEAITRFNESLYNPFIDTQYQDIINSYDNANNVALVKLEEEHLSLLDNGWNKLYRIFPSFVGSFFYSDYRKNKFVINKNELKLQKAIKKFYEANEKIFEKDIQETPIFYEEAFPFSREDVLKFFKYPKKYKGLFDDILSRIIQKTTATKLPKDKEIYFGISLNFADWFLASTSENWTSCLDFSSEYLMASGLPGTIIDKNRAMIFLTDGEEKEFFGIRTYKKIGRAWTLLTDDNEIYINKFYPQNDEINLEFFNKIFNPYKSVKKFTACKHRLDPIYYLNGKGAFIYQDNTRFYFKKEGNIKIKYNGEGGFYTCDKEREVTEHEYVFQTSVCSMKRIIEGCEHTLEKLAHVGLNTCKICGERTNLIQHGGEHYCKSCFYSRFIKCEDCGDFHSKENINNIEIDKLNYHICNYCLNKDYFKCNMCNTYHKLDDSTFKINERYFSDGLICKTCYEKYYTDLELCPNCNEYYPEDKIKNLDNGEKICVHCLNERVQIKNSFRQYELEFIDKANFIKTLEGFILNDALYEPTWIDHGIATNTSGYYYTTANTNYDTSGIYNATGWTTTGNF